MLSKLTKIFLKLIIVIYDKIKIFYKTLFFPIKYFQFNKFEKKKNILIFSTYIIDKNIIPQNLINSLKIFNDRNFYIILCNDNLLSSTQIKTLKKFVDCLIVRNNYGRDFGSYKFASLFLKKIFPKTDNSIGNHKIFYMNDSFVILKNRFSNILDKWLQLDEDIIALSDNVKPHYHLQSYFFSVSEKIFLSDSNINFWKNYFPSSLRQHCIKKGEMSYLNLVEHEEVHVFFNYFNLLKKYKSNPLKTKLSRVYRLDHLSRSFKSEDNFAKLSKEKFYNLYNDLNLFLKQDGNICNIFAQFLIANQELNFPIVKKDIVYTNQHHFNEIEEVISNTPSIEIDDKLEVLYELRKRDPIENLNFKNIVLCSNFLSYYKKLIRKYIDFVLD